MLKLQSFDEVLSELAALEKNPPPAHGEWSTGAMLAHCAQSIEYSISGYPVLRSGLFRATVGPLVLRRFLRQGFMAHSREAAIPGALALAGDLALARGAQRLREAIILFRGFGELLAPHFAYGQVSRADYERVHAMHVADHFSGVLNR